MNVSHVALIINMGSVSSSSWLGHHHKLILSTLLLKKKTVMHGAVQILNLNCLFGVLVLRNTHAFQHTFTTVVSVETKPNNFFKSKITGTDGTLLAVSCNTKIF